MTLSAPAGALSPAVSVSHFLAEALGSREGSNKIWENSSLGWPVRRKVQALDRPGFKCCLLSLSCVTWDKSLYLSEPQFSYLLSGKMIISSSEVVN